MQLKACEEGDWLVFQVRVQPRAPRSQVVGLWAGALKVCIAEAPDKGRANRALLAFLAEILGVTKPQIRLLAGARSRNKTVSVKNLSKAQLCRRVTPYIV